ncbi:hypothetical protein J0H58_28855 [bacterium]|nr:hypothetical protein [bacterium]
MAKQPSQPGDAVRPLQAAVADFRAALEAAVKPLQSGRADGAKQTDLARLDVSVFTAGLKEVRTNLSQSVKGLAGDLKAALEERAQKLAEVARAAGKALDEMRAKLEKGKEKGAELAERLQAAVQASNSVFRPINNALDALAERLTPAAKKLGDFLSPLSTALQGVGQAWKNAVAPVAALKAAMSDALAPVRAAREAFGTLTAPVRMLAALPGQVAGAVAGISQKAAGMLGGPTAALQSFFGRVQSTVGSLVEKANPGAVLRFNLALDDLYATLGQMLTPVLDQFTLIARTLGSALNGMTGEGKQLIAGLAAGAIGMAVFAAAAAAVQAALTGGIGPLLGAVAGALGGVAFASGAFKDAMKPVAAIIGGLGNQLGAVLTGLVNGNAFKSLLKTLGEVAQLMAASFSGQVSAFAPALEAAINAASQVFSTLLPALRAVGETNMALIAAGASLLAASLRLMTPVWTTLARIVSEVTLYINQLARMLLGFFGIQIPELQAPKGDLKDNTGAAAKSTSTTDVQSVLRSARESSFKAGLGAQGSDPASRTAGAVEGMKASVGNIATALQKLTPQEVAKALADIMLNAAGERARAGVRAAGDYVAGQAKEVRQAATLVNPLAGVILGQLEGAISRLRR